MLNLFQQTVPENDTCSMFNMTFTRLNVSAWLCQRTRHDGPDFIRLRLRENVLFITVWEKKILSAVCVRIFFAFRFYASVYSFLRFLHL